MYVLCLSPARTCIVPHPSLEGNISKADGGATNRRNPLWTNSGASQTHWRRNGFSAISLPEFVALRLWIAPRWLFSWKESAAWLPLPISRLVSPGHGLRVNSWKSHVGKKRTKRGSSAARGGEETTSVPTRIELSPDNIEQGLAKLVLTLIDFLRQLLERQAIRRMEGGALSDQEIEQMGEALMKLEAKIEELAEQFGLSPADLNIDLGPLSRLR